MLVSVFDLAFTLYPSSFIPHVASSLSSPNRSAGVMLDLRLSARISQSVCFYSHVLVTVFPNISALSTALYSICERPDDEVVDEFLRCVPLHDGCDGQ